MTKMMGNDRWGTGSGSRTGTYGIQRIRKQLLQDHDCDGDGDGDGGDAWCNGTGIGIGTWL